MVVTTPKVELFIEQPSVLITSGVPSASTNVGTITTLSVGNLAPIFTSNVANPTSTPSVTFTISNASANTLLAGPTTGAASAPTYRALVAADLPAVAVLTSGSYANPSWITSLAWSKITSTPTTRSGYGITDAQVTLVSGTNIKTINGSSLLGSGNLTIGGVSGLTTNRVPYATSATTLGDHSSFKFDSTGGGVLTVNKLELSELNSSGTAFQIGPSIVTCYAGFDFVNGLRTSGVAGNYWHVKYIDIGDWDMDTNVLVSIPHGLFDFKKVREITAIVRNDADSQYFNLNIDSDNTSVTSTNVVLRRITGGIFDSATFSGTGFNRGYIKLTYIA